MATSKTLSPTGVTIQIPAMTDAPDQRVNSNCIDKEADAINALSDQMGKQIKQIYYGNEASVSFSVGNGARHILIIASSGAPIESAIIFVSSTNAGLMSKGEVYKGSNITSIGTSVDNRITVNWSQTGNRYYFDIALAGNVMAKI